MVINGVSSLTGTLALAVLNVPDGWVGKLTTEEMDISNRTINWDKHEYIDWFDVFEYFDNADRFVVLDVKNVVVNVDDGVRRVECFSVVDCFPSVDVTDVKPVDIDVVEVATVNFFDVFDDSGFVNGFVDFDCVDADVYGTDINVIDVNDAAIFGTDGDDIDINIVVIAVNVDEDEIVNCLAVFESDNVKDVEGTVEGFDFVDSDVIGIMGNVFGDVAACNIICGNVESIEGISLLCNFPVWYGVGLIRRLWMWSW